MRPLAVVAGLLAAILAGCLGDDGQPAPSPTPTATGTSPSSTTTGAPVPVQVLDLLLAFEFTGCSGMSVRQERPIEDVQALLPAGFTASPGPGTANPDLGSLAVDLFVCGNLTNAAVAVPHTYVGLVYTFIERPTDRVSGAPEAAVHEYVFRLLAGTDVLATLWPAAGYDTYSGAANVSVGPPLEGADPRVRFGTANVGPVGEGYVLMASGMHLAPLAAARTQTFARYTVHAEDKDSVLVWTGTYDLPDSALGPGTVQVAADDPFAAYVPPEGEFLAGLVWQYDAGAVHGQDLRRIFTSAA